MIRIRPTFRVDGSKYNLSKWIISHFPPDYQELTYLEPYCGAASILLNKEPSETEAINDLDKGAIQILKALRNEPREFVRRLNIIKCCDESFQRLLKKESINDYLDDAIREYCIRKMSRDGLKRNFGWGPKTVDAGIDGWKKSLKSLPMVAERLREVHIFNKSAISVISTFNGKSTLIYCNPPEMDGKNMAMSISDHEELARILCNSLGKVVVSGTPGPLYNKLYKEWTHKKKISNNKREVLWKNF
jgi:DNA adenine methylase